MTTQEGTTRAKEWAGELSFPMSLWGHRTCLGPTGPLTGHHHNAGGGGSSPLDVSAKTRLASRRDGPWRGHVCVSSINNNPTNSQPLLCRFSIFLNQNALGVWGSCGGNQSNEPSEEVGSAHTHTQRKISPKRGATAGKVVLFWDMPRLVATNLSAHSPFWRTCSLLPCLSAASPLCHLEKFGATSICERKAAFGGMFILQGI